MIFAKFSGRQALLVLAIFCTSPFQSALYSQSEFTDVNGMFDDDEFDDELEEVPVERIEDEPPTREVTPIRRPRQITRPTTRPRPTPTRSPARPGSTQERGSLNFASEVPNPDEKLRMDFIQVEIEEVVKFFSERLQKKFIYDPAILQGQITIVSPTEVSVEEAWQAFMSAMEIRGYVVYPTGAYLKIDRVANARKAPVPLHLHSTPDDDSYVTRIINLRFLSVRDIRQAVRELVSRGGGDVIEHAPTNTLIISDYAANIRRIVRILNILDVEGFQEQIAVIPLNYASAGEVARKITEIFPTGPSASAPQQPRRPTRRNVRQPAQAPTGGGSGESVIQKVVADDRTNSLIILGSERGIDQVRRFIEQIDVPIEGGDGQIHVYPLQNVKAEDIAQTLASLTQGTTGTGGRPTAQQQQQQQQTPAQRARARAAAAAAGQAAESGSASLFDGDIRITADPRSNALIIMASPRDFETIKGIIQQLDVRRRQVFIESVILEASVGSGSRFGVQATGPLFRTGAMSGTDGQPKSAAIGGVGALPEGTNLLSILSGLSGAQALQGLALGFRSGGTVSVPFTTPDGDTETREVPLLSAILRLSADSGNINVLSTPHILATANEEAVISIGQEIPQRSSQGADSAGNPLVNIQRIRVATELRITPQINAGDYLTLEIDQKVNEPGDVTAAGDLLTITREAKTTAIVQDGQTVVIGGIMRDRIQNTTNKVPLLGDIPILGWLFKSRTRTADKVNLLLFITPHIIRDTADMDDVFFRKLEERSGFLRGIGAREKQGIPFSGYRREQLEFLDEDYLKSIKLTPLPTELPPEAVEPEGEIQLEPVDGRTREDHPTIPIGPIHRGTYDDDFLDDRDMEAEPLPFPSSPELDELPMDDDGWDWNDDPLWYEE